MPQISSLRLVIDETSARQRADKFLLAQPELQPYARAAIQKLFVDNLVLVNDQPVKSGHKLKIGEVVTADISPLQAEPDAIVLPILYEDADVIVINKPAGVLTHTNSAYRREASVASYIRSKLSGELSGERGGIVHRLDRRTSGIIICAKNQAALSWLQKQFAIRKVKKTYIAVVQGMLQPAEAIIDAPIARNANKPKTFHVDPSGKTAQTTYHVIADSQGNAVVRLEPMTGRTHQLRVHLAYVGHPILGDDLYNPHADGPLLLHAAQLEITLPNRERATFTAQVPDYFPAEAREATHA